MIRTLLLAGVIAGGLLFSAVSVSPVAASTLDPFSDVCRGEARSTAVCQDRGNANRPFSLMEVIINTLLFIAGLVAVIMIIIGAIRYVTSGGDPAGVRAAKDTVIYAVVGLVIAIMAYAVVSFVVGRL